MELEEAKLQLLSLKKDRESFIQNDKDHDYIFLKDIEAIETVLQELENRIPRKKIKEKIEELKKEGNYKTDDNLTGRVHFINEPCDYKLQALQELLEDKNASITN